MQAPQTDRAIVANGCSLPYPVSVSLNGLRLRDSHRGVTPRTMAAPKGKDAIEFLEGLPASYIALQCNRGLYDGRNAAAAGARR